MSRYTLPRLDRDAIRAQAERDVTADLDGHTDMIDLLAAASTLANDEQDAADRVRHKRDAAALSLALYDGMRTVYYAIGVNRSRFFEMRADALGLTESERTSVEKGGTGWLKNHTPMQIAARARKHKVPLVSAKRLPYYAEQTATHEERAKVARSVRNECVVALVGEGWTQEQIAEHMGRNRARVSQIMDRIA